jgi:hypothetical protein
VSFRTALKYVIFALAVTLADSCDLIGMTDLTGNYSGVVLNQNAIPTGELAWVMSDNGNLVYQTFTLPSNYIRGTDSPHTPDLSGFQVYCSIIQGFAEAATLNYVVQFYNEGWYTLTQGTQIGCHADGNVWFDVIFGQSIPVTPLMLSSQLRICITTPNVMPTALVPFDIPVEIGADGEYIINGIGYTATLTQGIPYPIVVNGYPSYLMQRVDGSIVYSYQVGVTTLPYVQPTPLYGQAQSTGQAYQADGLTPLLGAFTTSSFDFRILGLVADSGTDFMGNEYRSAVTTASVTNTDTTSTASGSTSGNYYMSPPQPSRFAVIPTYWDVRPQATSPSFGVANIVLNPSFEYDAINVNPVNWLTQGAAAPTLRASATWAASGVQSMKVTGTSTATNQLNGAETVNSAPVQGGQVYSVSAVANITVANTGGIYIALLWLNSSGSLVSSAAGAAQTGTGVKTLSLTATAPSSIGVASLSVAVYSKANANAEPFTFYVDSVCATQSANVLPYFDGDTVGYEWTGQKGDSPSIQLIAPSVQDNSIVVDTVLVDPLTPNMAFNVYYSTDDTGTSDNMTEADWEGKLWQRVPEVFLSTQRQQYALPEPIIAKYMCVEFTNLQAQSYDTGPFQVPISYKKFPTWVANFFIAEMDLPSFTVDQVNVQYDALDFAYSYYLDDLDQSPETPTAAPVDASAQLTSYFNSQTASSEAGLDATTLSQINLVMNIFSQTPVTNVDTSGVLGSYVQGIYNGTTPPNSTYENSIIPPVDYTTVSSLSREPVVFENTLPVMYFFLACRHAYKELLATFEYNRAYFAGINDIAFMRNDYTVIADTDLYIESGGDLQNAKRNDFVLDVDSNWYTYGA